MRYEFKTFNEILNGHLRPWLEKEISESKFTQDLHELEKSDNDFQPLYEVIYDKALSSKRKYYQQIIENESIDYLNYFHKKMEHSLNDDARSYLVHDALEKVLPSKFNKLLKQIQNHNYSETVQGSGNLIPNLDLKLADGVFVIGLMKHSFIRIYLEIQDAFRMYYSGLVFSPEDLYQKFFHQNEPSAAVIVEASPIKIMKQPPVAEKKIPHDEFIPLRDDFRDEKPGVLEYDKIVKNPSKFALFEEKLYSYGYIDEKYNFKNGHGQKNEMAMIFHHLINKNYFVSRNFDKRKPIKNTDIQKFLSHRYNADLYKQFQTYARYPEKVADFVQENYWLDNLPMC